MTRPKVTVHRDRWLHGEGNDLSTWLEGKEPSKHDEPILMRGAGYDYVLHTGFVL